MKRTLLSILVIGVLLLSACGAPITAPPAEAPPTAPPTEQPTPTTLTLSVSVSPSGAGSVSPSSGQYELGVQMTLTAIPASGYTFDYWGGDASGSSPTTAITMDSNKSITAHFKLAETPPTHPTSEEPSTPEPAEFVVSDLSISPGEVIAGESVTISFDVANSGGTTGTHTVTLKVNGSEIATKSLTLDAEQSQRVTFTAKTESGGTYTVEVDGLKGAFTATEKAVSGALAVSASVKFASLGGGTQTLYATITLNGHPVQGADVGITVYYKTVTRTFTASPTGSDGKTQISWSVGRPRGGYTVKIKVVATYQGQSASTTTGFYAP